MPTHSQRYIGNIRQDQVGKAIRKFQGLKIYQREKGTVCDSFLRGPNMYGTLHDPCVVDWCSRRPVHNFMVCGAVT